jgi:16S rRNA (uracil1498-N3)-methyltransferase
MIYHLIILCKTHSYYKKYTMQLFISDGYNLDQNNISIYDERIVHQCFHVLRYKSNQILQLQDKWIRYTLRIDIISKKEIQTIINKEETINSKLNTYNLKLLIALPNRFDKTELIVQKLTEIGIDHINFWKAERSILREIPDKKLQRLQSIALEASEQSFRRTIPTITYLDNLFESDILSSGQIILFHQDWIDSKNLVSNTKQLTTTIIGPEWWFSDNEIQKIWKLSNCTTITLWDTVLRMETAAIIWSRLIKNL